MNHAEFKSARQALGLTLAQLAKILDVDARTIRKWEADENASTGRRPNPVACQAMRWMQDGFRPPNFPDKS